MLTVPTAWATDTVSGAFGSWAKKSPKGEMAMATLDPDRVSKLTAVFWDMTGITVSEESVDHPASGTAEAWTETILHITITPRTADDMRIS